MSGSDKKIIFMGTPGFAVGPLSSLYDEGVEVAAVITAPDRPAGRGKKVRFSPVKEFAVEKDIPVLQPPNLKAEEFVKELEAIGADLFVVVAFRMLPEVVWSMPPLGTINLHASLLPDYRGAAPINRAIMNGERETGVTTFFITKEIDTGDIIDRIKVKIDEDMTAGELHDELMDAGSDLLVRTVEDIFAGQASRVSQEELLGDESELSGAPKIFPDDCRIDWTKSPKEIYDHVRGLNPYPSAWTILKDGDEEIRLKVHEVDYELTNHSLQPGAMVEGEGVDVACNGGVIKLKVVQQAGRKRMSVDDFLRGFMVKPDQKFL